MEQRVSEEESNGRETRKKTTDHLLLHHLAKAFADKGSRHIEVSAFGQSVNLLGKLIDFGDAANSKCFVSKNQ
jgi:hypothetical protein